MKASKIQTTRNPASGQRVILTLKQTPGGSAINSMNLIESFDDWQLVHTSPCAQGILYPYRHHKILLYLPKMGMCQGFKMLHMKNGIWRLSEGFVLPDNLCQALHMQVPGIIEPGQYRPVDLGGHWVFRLTWTTSEDVFLDY